MIRSSQLALGLGVIIRFLILILLLSVEQAIATPILFFGWWSSWQRQQGFILSLGLCTAMAGLFGLIMSIPWWISVLIFCGGWWVERYRPLVLGQVRLGLSVVVIVQMLLTMMVRGSTAWRSVGVYLLLVTITWLVVLIWSRPGNRRHFLSKRVL